MPAKILSLLSEVGWRKQRLIIKEESLARQELRRNSGIDKVHSLYLFIIYSYLVVEAASIVIDNFWEFASRTRIQQNITGEM